MMEVLTALASFPPEHLLASPRCRLVLELCLRRLRRWRVPPHWSPAEWHEEIGLEAMTVAQEAALTFDERRGIPLEWFVRRRVLCRALDFYRKEWAFGLRWSAERDDDGPEAAGPRRPSPAEDPSELLAALERLADGDRWLIEQLFWNEAREAEVARALKISQQAVNRRKHLILQHLRRQLSAPTARAAKIPVVKSGSGPVILVSSRQGRVSPRVHQGGLAS